MTATSQRKRGRPKNEPVLSPVVTNPPVQPFTIMIPEQLRTCLMARDDVEAVVRKVIKEVNDEVEARQALRKVSLSEAMERLQIKSRSTLWHWHEQGYMIQEHDEHKHVYYPEYKIRRAERGEHPETGGMVDAKQEV